jgi:serine/threonine protein kinase/Tfp pilus assembly protein PilF
VDRLVDGLVAQMADAWRRGERRPAEEYLARHPELRRHPEGAVRVIYEEVCLREGLGAAVPVSEVVRRFPQWRAELELLLDCHGLLRPPRPTVLPEAGETLGDYRLLAELGRGSLGRVFLASQPALADRPLVLKVTPSQGHEHLSLARLQHTHIVPLYAAHEFPDRNLRVLCMPYLGGLPLAQVLARLEGRPPGQRDGRSLVEALDQAPAASEAGTDRGPARAFLARVSYAEAVCWVGACLADALAYAHERGLVHLDIKPSNVLLAADGQPLLLDFHLAREPVRAGEMAPDWLGGTRGSMSPEQQAALAAVRDGRPVPADVDGRSDVYSLGLLLYEVLAGPVPQAGPLPRLHRRNPQAGLALSDLIHKCLERDPRRRYPGAAALADDLRRQLRNLPLNGVRNRSLGERWRKWRRRRPNALALAVLWLVVLAGTAGVGVAGLTLRAEQAREVLAALAEGRRQLEDREYAEAMRTLSRGLDLAEGVPGEKALAGELGRQLRRARRGLAAENLHHLAEELRFRFADAPPAAAIDLGRGRALDRHCGEVWDQRDLLADRAAPVAPETEAAIPEDLGDLALFRADLRVRLAPAARRDAARAGAARDLAEAEALCGPSPALARARRAYAGEAGPELDPAPRTAHDYCALGRSLLQEGRPAEAAAALDRAVELHSGGFWPNFYQGVCAFRRGRYDEAVAGFRVCVALAPRRAECFYNRGLAREQLGLKAAALRDYDRAVELDPGFAPAALNRGLLHYAEGRYARARADLLRAAELGADPAAVRYDLALVALAEKDWAGARASLEQALEQDPGHARARELLGWLGKRWTPGGPGVAERGLKDR